MGYIAEELSADRSIDRESETMARAEAQRRNPVAVYAVIEC